MAISFGLRNGVARPRRHGRPRCARLQPDRRWSVSRPTMLWMRVVSRASSRASGLLPSDVRSCRLRPAGATQARDWAGQGGHPTAINLRNRLLGQCPDGPRRSAPTAQMNIAPSVLPDIFFPCRAARSLRLGQSDRRGRLHFWPE